MKEILLTSSVLILALLLLRVLFRSAVSRRVQYALWLLVLVRLLVPVHLPAVNFSLLTAAEPGGTGDDRTAGSPGALHPNRPETAGRPSRRPRTLPPVWRSLHPTPRSGSFRTMKQRYSIRN